MARFDFDSLLVDCVDWSKTQLTDNPPCATCENRTDLRTLNSGMTVVDTSLCNNCIKRWNYISNCLMKLAWYEEQERKKTNRDQTNP